MTQYQLKDCPRCNGTGEYETVGDSHKSAGIVPCYHRLFAVDESLEKKRKPWIPNKPEQRFSIALNRLLEDTLIPPCYFTANLECCRLQGFPDDYFDGVLYRGKPLADGPRYRLLGNSMAVPVMAWIGQRIDLMSKE